MITSSDPVAGSIGVSSKKMPTTVKRALAIA